MTSLTIDINSLFQEAGGLMSTKKKETLWRGVVQWNDIGFGKFTLHFIRNKEKQEVDFLIANEGRPFLLVETKISETKPSPA